MGTRQVRVAQGCSSEIGISEISLREIERAQVEPSQTSPRQVGRYVLFLPPRVPCCSAASENSDMFIV